MHAARGPADPDRRHARLPPRRHGAVLRPAAGRAPRRQGRRRARADRRPLHDGPLRRRDRLRVHQPRHVIPVHYDTFPPIETDAQAFKTDVENQTSARSRARARRDAYRVTHAIVLIEAERAAMPTLGGQLADVEGVAEAYSVTGEWDFVAILRVRNPEELAPSSPAGSPRSTGSSARTRWSRSRCSRSTTWRRCSRSAISGAGAARGRPGGVRGEDRAVRAAAEGGAVAGGRRGRRGADPPARGDHRRQARDQAGERAGRRVPRHPPHRPQRVGPRPRSSRCAAAPRRRRASRSARARARPARPRRGAARALPDRSPRPAKVRATLGGGGSGSGWRRPQQWGRENRGLRGT